MRQTQGDEILLLDAKLVRDPVDLPFLGHRDRIIGRRDGEQASHQCQLLVVGRQIGELPGHEEVRRAAEEHVAGFRQLHDDHRLVVREGSLLLHEPFHRACFFRRYVLIGVRHAPKEIGKRREDTSAVGLEVIQGVERLTKRRELRLLRRVYSQPCANGLHGHRPILVDRPPDL